MKQLIAQDDSLTCLRRDADTLERVLRTNLIGAFRTIQAFHPLLRVRGPVADLLCRWELDSGIATHSAQCVTEGSVHAVAVS